MPLSKVKQESELEVDDWLDLKRSDAARKHRRALAREKNAIMEEAHALVAAGRVLRVEEDE